MSEEKKAQEAWTHYWDRGAVAETFGGREELEKNPKYLLEEKPIADLVPECHSILDAGCGVGRYTQLVKDKCKLYVGVDFSEAMLAQARKNNPYDNVAYQQGDLESINFENLLRGANINATKFDVGLLVAIIRHLPTEKGLAVLRHVKSGCKMLLFTSFIVPEDKEIPMIVKGLDDNKIIDIPYHLKDIKKALGVTKLQAMPLGDRDPTEGKRFLFSLGSTKLKPKKKKEKPKEKSQKKKKPLNRIATFMREIHGK